MPFWAFLFGGCFLYMAYYGTDQSQAQRLLSTRSAADSRRALMLNGYARFPLVCLYVAFGVALAAVLSGDPTLAAAVERLGTDSLVPQFIIGTLPAGLRGLLVAALIAAAMSSIDSALNALSAATIRDFLPARHNASLAAGRIVTSAWGIAITSMAFVVDRISETVIEAVNQIGSAFYGPVLAAFLLGLGTRSITSSGIWTGVVSGVALNLTLWIGFPTIHWMWWNVFGCACTAVAAAAVTLTRGRSPAADPLTAGDSSPRISAWKPSLLGLAVYAAAILAALTALDQVP
jgi:SSS family solute:Na+ symporter